MESNSTNNSLLKAITGTLLSQIIIIVFTPIITRIYSPEVFGISAAFLAIANIFGSIICLRLEFSIIIPKSENESFKLLKLSIIVAILNSLILTIIFFFFKTNIFISIKIDEFIKFWYLLPVIVFLLGLNSALVLWLSRKNRYSTISISKIVYAITMIFASILLGKYYSSSSVIRIISNLLGMVVSILIIIIVIFNKDNYSLKCEKKYFFLIKENKTFITYDVIANIFSSMSWQIVPILFSIYFNSEVAGKYSLSISIIQLPMSLIGNAISQVFYSQSRSARIERTLIKHLNTILWKMIKICFFPSIILVFITKPMFGIIFGEQWKESGYYTQILMPWAIVWFIANPIGMIIITLKKQKFALIIHAVNLFLKFTAIYVGHLFKDLNLSLILISIFGVVIYIIIIIYSFYIAKESDNLIVEK